MLTSKFPQDERYGLVSQLRRAAVSVPSNIAEGYERHHFADQINFFINARGSCGEVQSELLLAKDLGYPDKEKIKNAVGEYRVLSKRINAYISFIRRQE